jgi:hypothetical protein
MTISKPNRRSDFTSGSGSTSMSFWFEPEMVMMMVYSPFNIVINEMQEKQGKLYIKTMDSYDVAWPTLQDAYKANLKRLHNEVDKILLEVDDV